MPLTGDTDLTLSAPISNDAVWSMRGEFTVVDVRATQVLIFCVFYASLEVNSANGTTMLTGTTRNAVFKRRFIGSLGGVKFGVGNDTSQATGHAFFCDEGARDTEGAQPGSVGGMTL